MTMTAKEFIAGMESGKLQAADLYSPHFKAGDFSPNDILEVYQVKDSPRFIAKVQAFIRGSLFAAQTQDFDQYLEGTHRREDTERAWEFLSVEKSAMQLNEGIHLFIQCRIYYTKPSPKELENLGHRENLRTLWMAQNKKNGWEWRL